MPPLSAADLEAQLSALRAEAPDLFDQIVLSLKQRTRPSRPLFPPSKPVIEIPAVPGSERDAFKDKYIDMSKIKDYDSPEAQKRLNPASRVRDTQYIRWEWACANFETYVNMLRVMGHGDENIQAMLEGVPLCMKSREMMEELKDGLRELKKGLEEEHGWGNVGFVFTGSSVPGFSQNPMKGREREPTRITSVEGSDVDICIVGDGVEVFVHKLRNKGLWTSSYPTTCTRTRSGTRFGVDWSVLESGALGKFYGTWKEKLEGGLQLTFCEDNMELPPWEITVKLD